MAHGGRGGMRGSMDIDRLLKHLYVGIEATEEQQQRLDPIVKQAMSDLTPLRQNLRAARGDSLRLLAQERVLIDASEVLNPAQRRQLAAYFARGRRFT